VPDAVVSLLGGPDGGVDRVGGLRVRYRPTPDFADRARLIPATSTVRHDGGVLVLDYPGTREDMVPEILDVLVAGGLEMREALETDYAQRTGLPICESRGDRVVDPSLVCIDFDQWRPDDGSSTHTVAFVRGPSREAIEQAVSAAGGWQLSPGAQITYERVDGWDPRDRTYWRSHELAREVPIDGSMIADARASYDPSTNRPIVLLDFTRAGGQRFGELTERISGRKLATILGDRVRSAPIINGPIRGGRASITMGGSDPRQQEHERDALVAVLRQGALPPGGTIEHHEVVRPAGVALQEWLGRLLLGVLAGGLFGAVVWLLLRATRPIRAARVPRPATGEFPWLRLAVTLLAPAVLFVGSHLTLPGVNDAELEHIIFRGGGGLGIGAKEQFSVIALGVMPILTSFLLVEVVALAAPWWRWRRHDPRGRVGLGKAVAVTSTAVALVQGYFVAVYLEVLSRGGAEVVATPGWKFRILVMMALAVGTLLLAVIAGMIREHGLGNGYGVITASGVAIHVFGPLLDDPDAFFGMLSRGRVLGAATLIVIAVATVYVLRWRIATRDREPALRLPTCGISPLGDTGGLVTLIGVLSAVGLGEALLEATYRVYELRANEWLLATILVVTIPLWAWLFARPSLVERVALQAGLERPSWATWRRALAVSAAFSIFVYAAWTFAILTDADAASWTDAVTAIICMAVLLDVIADARAHRQKLAPAAVLHQIQYAAVVERVLADAGIPCHIHANHYRTLLAFFGPFAPAIVMVPAELAADARTKLDDVLRAPTAKVPAARVAP
jgi:hypothetical protein